MTHLICYKVNLDPCSSTRNLPFHIIRLYDSLIVEQQNSLLEHQNIAYFISEVHNYCPNMA